MRGSIKSAYDKQKQSRLSLDERGNFLVRLRELNYQTTIVIDALDECEDSDKLLWHPKKLPNSPSRTTKFFFSNRMDIQLDDFPVWEKLELGSKKSLMADEIKEIHPYSGYRQERAGRGKVSTSRK